MPYIKCYNSDEEKFNQLTTKSQEIADLVNTKPDKVSFIRSNDKFVNTYVNIVYIIVDWLDRPVEYKELFSKYLKDHFKTDDNKVMVVFNSISDNYYIDGIAFK